MVADRVSQRERSPSPTPVALPLRNTPLASVAVRFVDAGSAGEFREGLGGAVGLAEGRRGRRERGSSPGPVWNPRRLPVHTSRQSTSPVDAIRAAKKLGKLGDHPALGRGGAPRGRNTKRKPRRQPRVKRDESDAKKKKTVLTSSQLLVERMCAGSDDAIATVLAELTRQSAEEAPKETAEAAAGRASPLLAEETEEPTGSGEARLKASSPELALALAMEPGLRIRRGSTARPQRRGSVRFPQNQKKVVESSSSSSSGSSSAPILARSVST